ncbi:uncharacterized protein LOC136064940 [Quercus suber]|uniref:uncharacterized protein LOC136064940 n=1 Tax=Quercus suber TaxID=58331 RepID=UPI0032DF7379
MNAFKAFKACAPIEWSPNVHITLVRGILGPRRLHRRTLEALHLCKCNRTVKRLVLVETEEMFEARQQKEANHRALCPPLVVNHLPGLFIG